MFCAPALAFCTLVACPPGPVHAPPDAAPYDGPVIVGYDSAPGYDASAVARAACAVLCLHECPECTGKDGGRSCEAQFDHDRAGSGGAFDLAPECVADAGSLAGIRGCGTVHCVGGK